MTAICCWMRVVVGCAGRADALRKTRPRCGPERQLHDAAAKGLATETNLLCTVKRLGRHGTQATRQLLPMQPSTPFKSVLPVATQSSVRLWLDFKHALGSETMINGNNTAFREQPLVRSFNHPPSRGHDRIVLLTRVRKCTKALSRTRWCKRNNPRLNYWTTQLRRS